MWVWVREEDSNFREDQGCSGHELIFLELTELLDMIRDLQGSLRRSNSSKKEVGVEYHSGEGLPSKSVNPNCLLDIPTASSCFISSRSNCPEVYYLKIPNSILLGQLG